MLCIPDKSPPPSTFQPSPSVTRHLATAANEYDTYGSAYDVGDQKWDRGLRPSNRRGKLGASRNTAAVEDRIPMSGAATSTNEKTDRCTLPSEYIEFRTVLEDSATNEQHVNAGAVMGSAKEVNSSTVELAPPKFILLPKFVPSNKKGSETSAKPESSSSMVRNSSSGSGVPKDEKSKHEPKL